MTIIFLAKRKDINEQLAPTTSPSNNPVNRASQTKDDHDKTLRNGKIKPKVFTQSLEE